MFVFVQGCLGSSVEQLEKRCLQYMSRPENTRKDDEVLSIAQYCAVLQ